MRHYCVSRPLVTRNETPEESHMTLPALPREQDLVRPRLAWAAATLAVLAAVVAAAPALPHQGPGPLPPTHHRSGASAQLLYSFRGGQDGALPSARLQTDTSGSLYGTTQAGGAKNLGTVFKLTPSGSG